MDMSTANAEADAATFLLDPQYEELLCQSDGFNILRRHLAETYNYNFCNKHNLDKTEQFRWLLVRDVLHALLVPVVELFDKALNLAISVTHATTVEDLEHAFSGQGRSAFLWLHCFLSNEREREWCYTKGCPACVIQHSLYSEFSVRMLHAACLLSDVHYPFTLDGPKLPSFRFFLEPLELALASDPLYGEDFFERMQSKAETTRNGIEELIHQCIELEMELSEPSSPSGFVSSSASTTASSKQSSPLLAPLGSSASSERGMKLKRGTIARRQMSLRLEEEQWMEEMVKRCWEQLQPDGHESRPPAAAPAMRGPPKVKTAVTVSEVQSIG